MNDLPLLLVLQAHPSQVTGTQTVKFQPLHFSDRKRRWNGDKPDEFLEGVQVIFAGHDHTEDVSPHLRVHPLLPGQVQHFGAELNKPNSYDS